MKPLYCYFICLLLSFNSFAQPVLDQGNGFNNGVTIHKFVDTAPTLNEGSAGINQTWDFSSLIDSNPATDYFGILATATPYADSFPNAMIATLNVDAFGDSIYHYFTNDTAYYTLWGQAASTQQTMNYSDPRDVLHYPFTYSDSFMDSYSFTSPFSSDYGQVEVTADGYGTLLLPQGAFDNCVRVREVKKDTAEGEFWVNFSNDTSFKFYSSDFVEPLCEVNHHHSSNLNSYTEIYWQNVGVEGISLDNDGSTFAFSFPNPCDGQLNILIPCGGYCSLIEVTDITGKNFEIDWQVKRNLMQLNTTGLADGIYFVTGKCGNKIFKVKFVKNMN